MSKTALVMGNAIKNNFRLPAVAMITFSVIFICIIGVAAIFITQFIIPQTQSGQPDIPVIENFLGLVLYTSGFMSIGIYSGVFAFQSLMREKARGNIQALLATPLDPRAIWFGKSLAVFLPGLAFSVVMTLAVLLAINFIFIVPYVGFVISPWMIVSSFIAVPLIYLSLIFLVHAVGLAGEPATANIIAQIFLPVILTLMINLAVRDIPGAANWLFAVILLGIAVVLSFITYTLRSNLTVEKIILSQ